MAEWPLDELRAALKANIRALAENLLGPPNKASKKAVWWRWGGTDGMAVCVRGPKQGACTDFRDGWKGDLLALVMRERLCDFREAARWASCWAGIAFDDAGSFQEDPATHQRKQTREAERARKRAAADAVQAADDAKRVAVARRLWDGAQPLSGTVAERYLTVARCIPKPFGGWPGSSRFHPGRLLLVGAGTNDAGELQFVHVVELTPAGKKAPVDKPKVSYGPMRGAYVRLPGPADGPLLVAEGLETSLSVWIATGCETWATCGVIGDRLKPPRARLVVVCRDDDKLTSPADASLKRGMARWSEAGADIAVATPWHERRQDKSDFNDLLKAHGVEAVRKRIELAMGPEHDAIVRVLVKEGRRLIAAAIARFYQLFMEERLTMTAFVRALKAELGLGKSMTNLRHLTGELRRMREAGDSRGMAVFVPTHNLGSEQVKKFQAVAGAGLTAGVWRSRHAENDDGGPMCMDPDAIKDANAALADPQTACCRKKMPDGTVAVCEHFDTCAFQAQRNARNDVTFMAHEMLFSPKPAGVLDAASITVDESAWQDALFGNDGKNYLLLETLLSEPAAVPDDDRFGMASGQLSTSRHALHSALTEILNSTGELDPNKAMRLPVAREVLLRWGMSAATAADCHAYEWRRKTEPNLYPAMPVHLRKKAVLAVTHNAIVAKLASIWKAVAALLEPDGPALSGRLHVGLSKNKEGVAGAVFIQGRKEVHEDWQVPTLLMDATMQPDLVKRVWPSVELVADVKVHAPHQHVTQVADRSYSLVQLRKESGLRDVHAIICREARKYHRGRVLAVCQKEVKEALPNLGLLPPNVELGHHNNVAGRDEWGPQPDRPGVELLIVIGRTEPPPSDMEAMAEALTGVAVERIEGWYPKATGAREMASGRWLAAETSRHPDATVEAIRWAACERELVQIIGRGRGVNRTADNPLDVLALTNAVLPLPVEKLISAASLDPDPGDLMLAAGGVAFENPADAAKAYPQLWRNREAAKKAFERAENERLGTNRNKDSLLRNVPNLQNLHYQRTGAGRSPTTAYADLRTVPDPKSWLIERLGPLRSFSMPNTDPDPSPDPEDAPYVDTALIPGVDMYRARQPPRQIAISDLLVIRTRNGDVPVRAFDATLPLRAKAPLHYADSISF